MLHAAPPDPFAALLRRPELLLVARDTAILADADGGRCFTVDAGGTVRMGTQGDGLAQRLRHALELAWLRQAGIAPVLAGLAAARTALLFGRLDRVSRRTAAHADQASLASLAALNGTAPPAPDQIGALWAALARHQPHAPADAPADTPIDTADRLAAVWPLLGPAEWLMEQGGDARLRVDPETGLNGYGCSHRPRPWAITYASSTASSVSERGYAAAETARRALLTQAMLGGAGIDALLARDATALRRRIGAAFRVPEGGDVVLAASGTDCELLALGIAETLAADRAAPVTNILLAPEETGTGVPLAATGRHFAADTAFGAAVARGAVIAGFRDDTRLVAIPVRGADGAVRAPDAVAASCAEAVAAAPGPCVLHLLDVSKTGLLAPDRAAVAAAEAARPDLFVVVDACQARITPARVRADLMAGRIVLVTGSKFFTGPPFAGAVLLPPGIVAALNRATTLPAGLRDYTARAEWPGVAAAAALPPRANPGLLTRWHAALAEIDAFRAVPVEIRRDILSRFTAAIGAAVAANPDLLPIAVPALRREAEGVSDYEWDAIGTIIGFAPRHPASGLPMEVDAARAVYGWLNADLSEVLFDLPPHEHALARQWCHIGQPAPMPNGAAPPIGILRLSAGARLVSGEPSHAGLHGPLRVAQEIEDALTVLRKTSLILRHLDRLQRSAVRPRFGS